MRRLNPYEIEHLRRFGQEKLIGSDIGKTPVEYLTNKVEFCGNVFKVTKETLIPRIESEELVELAIATLKKRKKDVRTELALADVGCGSGVLGISVAEKLLSTNPTHPIHLYLSDFSETTLDIARQNAKKLLPNQVKVTFLISDLFEEYKDAKFDLILANLPYIPHDRIEKLDSSVKDFEPRLALDGGDKGLEVIKRFLNKAPRFLKPEGTILLEIDETQDLTELVDETMTGEIRKDQFGKNRFAIIKTLDNWHSIY